MQSHSTKTRHGGRAISLQPAAAKHGDRCAHCAGCPRLLWDLSSIYCPACRVQPSASGRDLWLTGEIRFNLPTPESAWPPTNVLWLFGPHFGAIEFLYRRKPKLLSAFQKHRYRLRVARVCRALDREREGPLAATRTTGALASMRNGMYAEAGA